MRVAVGVGAAAQQVGAGLQRLTQQGLGTRVVQHALLRKYADLQTDRPGVVGLQALYRAQPGQADLRIDLDVRAHVRGALHDGLFQYLGAALVNVVFTETGLGLPGLLYRFGQGAVLQAAAAHDAGLVEMDVGFDQSRQDQLSGQIALADRLAAAELADKITVFNQQFVQAVLTRQAQVAQV